MISPIRASRLSFSVLFSRHAKGWIESPHSFHAEGNSFAVGRSIGHDAVLGDGHGDRDLLTVPQKAQGDRVPLAHVQHELNGLVTAKDLRRRAVL